MSHTTSHARPMGSLFGRGLHASGDGPSVSDGARYAPRIPRRTAAPRASGSALSNPRPSLHPLDVSCEAGDDFSTLGSVLSYPVHAILHSRERASTLRGCRDTLTHDMMTAGTDPSSVPPSCVLTMPCRMAPRDEQGRLEIGPVNEDGRYASTRAETRRQRTQIKQPTRARHRAGEHAPEHAPEHARRHADNARKSSNGPTKGDLIARTDCMQTNPTIQIHTAYRVARGPRSSTVPGSR